MIKIKAWNARNSRAIAKFHNTEIDYFGLKLIGHDLFRGSLSHQIVKERANLVGPGIFFGSVPPTGFPSQAVEFH